MPSRRTLAIIAASILAVALGYWLFRPKPVLVETATVLETRFTAIIEEDGRTRVRDRYTISAPLSGRLARPLLRAGDAIKTGMPLAYIAPNPAPLIDPRARQELEERIGAAEASVEEAVALQERARVLLTRAQTDLGRTKQLREKGVTAVAQLERDTFSFQSAERELAAADRRRHAAEHALAQARSALARSGENSPGERFAVLSPIDGRVLKVAQESESAIAVGASLVELGDPADLEVVVDVLTSDAVAIREGSRVSIERWGGPAALEARVRRVEPSGFTKVSALGVEEQRVWVIADITSPREQWVGLGDGFRVDVKIVVDETERATVVPIGALFRRGGAWHVFAVESGRARLKQVELVRRSGRLAAVLQGQLQPGEMMVVYPPTALADGSVVRTR
jgi:HlyD family secretion protein